MELIFNEWCVMVIGDVEDSALLTDPYQAQIERCKLSWAYFIWTFFLHNKVHEISEYGFVVPRVIKGLREQTYLLCEVCYLAFFLIDGPINV
jgi:hypothetical protein